MGIMSLVLGLDMTVCSHNKYLSPCNNLPTVCGCLETMLVLYEIEIVVIA